MKPKKLLAPIGALLAAISCASLADSKTEALALEAPQISEDGSFVIRLSTNAQNTTKTPVILLRNKNGGEFEKVAEVPLFSSFSQIIMEEGRYGYIVRKKGNTAKASQPIFVEVKRNMRLLPDIQQETRISANI